MNETSNDIYKELQYIHGTNPMRDTIDYICNSMSLPGYLIHFALLQSEQIPYSIDNIQLIGLYSVYKACKQFSISMSIKRLCNNSNITKSALISYIRRYRNYRGEDLSISDIVRKYLPQLHLSTNIDLKKYEKCLMDKHLSITTQAAIILYMIVCEHSNKAHEIELRDICISLGTSFKYIKKKITHNL